MDEVFSVCQVEMTADKPNVPEDLVAVSPPRLPDASLAAGKLMHLFWRGFLSS